MFDVNRVHLAGRISAVYNRETKNGKSFMVVSVIINKRNENGTSSEPTYINVMIFNPILIDYMNKIKVGKGYFVIIDGELSNHRIGNVRNALSILADDINVVIKANAGEEPPTTENAIMEDFDEYDF